MRKARKDDHIEQYLKTEFEGDTLLSDVYIEPNSLPELSFDEIQTETMFCGKRIAFPLMINAMTGGTDMTEVINQDLALLAKEFGLPMQVGSQQVALENEDSIDSFTVVRSVLGEESVVLSNLSARASAEEIRRAMDMISADAIGLHLNVAQELVMAEGERDFRGILDNLHALNREFPGKLLVKEIGFGMSRRVGQQLSKTGISMIDISGAGGTNFLEIEDQRAHESDFSEFYQWGIPTAKSLLNVRAVCPTQTIIASGGLKTANDLIRAMVLGADLCGMSGEILRYLLVGGYDYARSFLKSLIYRTRVGMAMLGCRTVQELRCVPCLLVGALRERTEESME